MLLSLTIICLVAGAILAGVNMYTTGPIAASKAAALEAAIKATEIHTPKCPVYQNADALPHTDPAEIKKNLVAQLTASVRWTQSVKNMVADGATDFTECGPGAVLQGLIKKIDGTVNAHGIA